MKKLTSMFLFLSFVITFFYFSSSYAEVYKWKDSRGELHYSDQPPTDQNKAEIIKIKAQKPSGDANSPNALEDNSKIEQAVKTKLKDYKEQKDHNSAENIEDNLRKLKAMPDINSKKNAFSDETQNTDNSTSQPSNSSSESLSTEPEQNPIDEIDKQSHLSNRNCTIALQNLKNLKDNKIILNKQNRKLVRLTDAEHAKKMNQTQKNIEKFC